MSDKFPEDCHSWPKLRCNRAYRLLAPSAIGTGDNTNGPADTASFLSRAGTGETNVSFPRRRPQAASCRLPEGHHLAIVALCSYGRSRVGPIPRPCTTDAFSQAEDLGDASPLDPPQAGAEGDRRAALAIVSAVTPALSARMLFFRLLGLLHFDCGKTFNPRAQVVREHKGAATAFDGAQRA
jgi:hypothetical protein